MYNVHRIKRCLAMGAIHGLLHLQKHSPPSLQFSIPNLAQHRQTQPPRTPGASQHTAEEDAIRHRPGPDHEPAGHLDILGLVVVRERLRRHRQLEHLAQRAPTVADPVEQEPLRRHDPAQERLVCLEHFGALEALDAQARDARLLDEWAPSFVRNWSAKILIPITEVGSRPRSWACFTSGLTTIITTGEGDTYLTNEFSTGSGQAKKGSHGQSTRLDTVCALFHQDSVSRVVAMTVELQNSVDL